MEKRPSYCARCVLQITLRRFCVSFVLDPISTSTTLLITLRVALVTSIFFLWPAPCAFRRVTTLDSLVYYVTIAAPYLGQIDPRLAVYAQSWDGHYTTMYRSITSSLLWLSASRRPCMIICKFIFTAWIEHVKRLGESYEGVLIAFAGKKMECFLLLRSRFSRRRSASIWIIGLNTLLSLVGFPCLCRLLPKFSAQNMNYDFFSQSRY